jgi:hypothetical protein
MQPVALRFALLLLVVTGLVAMALASQRVEKESFRHVSWRRRALGLCA